MGSSLSVCGLGASHDNAPNKQHPRAFEREKVMELLAHNDRTRTLSVTTDTSVASILSNSDRLIPDAFMPVDIQVVSQRRVRPTSSSVLLQQSQSYAHGSTTPSKTSSHYYNNSAHANAAFLRYMTSSTSATTSESVPMSERVSTKRKQQPQVMTESHCSYYASYPEDDESGLLSSRSSRRSGNHSHLSTRDLVKGF